MRPVAKIGLISLMGTFMARSGILNESGRLVVSRLNFSLFTPALFLEKFSSFSISQICDSIPTHIMMLATHIIGAVLGMCLVRASPADSELRSIVKHVVSLTAIGNVGNLPMVLVESLDSLDGMFSAASGLSHVLMANISASLLQFPIVSFLLNPTATAANALSSIITPSVIAAVLGVMIGQSPFLKDLICGF